MSKAIGGYIKRSDRRYIPPEPDDSIPRCDYGGRAYRKWCAS